MASDLEQRREIGRYTIVKRLSIGGMAEVFLAYAAGPGAFRKLVTLKRILPDLREDEEFVRMFLDEARISASLSHANIAQVFDLSAEADELYLAMEFVAGEDLSRILKNATKRQMRIPLGFTSMVVRDAATALHYAHTYVDPTGRQVPIIHRDITPKNIMVSYAGAVKVIDFGIAKMKYDSGVARSTSVKGSSGYMSPEQRSGRDVDARSDIFSLGVVMYELLTGMRLFKSDTPGLAVPDPERVVAPHVVVPGVPEALSALVVQMLAFDPDTRVPSAREVVRALEAAAPDMFDAERTAELMQRLFADGIEATRVLLASVPEPRAATVPELPRWQTTERHAGADEVTAPIDVTDDGTHVSVPTTVRLGAEPMVDEGARPRVLAVDDSISSLRVLQAQLVRDGFEVVGATTVAEAIAALDTMRFDAIILDVIMPEIDGFELCRRIRERPGFRSTPILFLSAACSLEERIRGLQVGGDDFIRKPYTASELALRVRSHLARVAMLHDPARGAV